MRIGDRFPLFSVLLILVFLLASPFTEAQKTDHSSAPPAPPQRSSQPVASSHTVSAHSGHVMVNSSTFGKSRSSAKTAGTDAWAPGTFASSSPSERHPETNSEFTRRKPVREKIPPRSQGPIRAGGSTSGFGSGFYLLGGEGGYFVSPDDSAVRYADELQPDDLQPDDQAPDSRPDAAQDQGQPQESLTSDQYAPEPEGDSAASVQDEGEFTLVLRDGSRIPAVAFTHSNDKIIYISLDGGRRTFADADLDADATVRVNQERGTPLQLPL